MIAYDRVLLQRMDKLLGKLACVLMREKALKKDNLDRFVQIKLYELQTIYDLLVDLNKDRKFQYEMLNKLVDRLNTICELSGEFK
jgi:hypothetical protein